MMTGVTGATSMGNYSQLGKSPLQSPVSNIIDQYHYRDNDGLQQSGYSPGAQEYSHPRAKWEGQMGWSSQQQQQQQGVRTRHGDMSDSISEYSDLYDVTAANAHL
jgi:hypothetical protein